MVIVMTEHNCLHEEQIISQSRTIERLDAELGYKKERLDELKEDNRRMEQKIDDIGKNLDTFIHNSDSNDTKLDLRITKIETRQEVQDEATKKNRDDFKLWLSIITVIFAAVTIYFNFLK